MKRVFSLILLSLFILLSVSTGFAANADVSGRPLILTIKVEGMITPGTAAIIERGVQEASVRNASALILILDTPGGIVDATLKILSVLSSSDVPIIIMTRVQLQQLGHLYFSVVILLQCHQGLQLEPLCPLQFLQLGKALKPQMKKL